MKFLQSILPGLISLLLAGNLYGQPTSPPKIGIALSGGGAKGLAHIGVLKVLEEEGIYPSFIAGTSMGSVVGGLYATGYSAKDLDSLAHKLKWETYFSDEFDRNYLSIEEKSQSERYLFAFPYANGKVQLPKGFIDGQKLGLMLSQLTIHAHSIDRFDDFEIPFRCVATNLLNGEAVVFDSGFLPDAIRSSIGIPSVFEPFQLDSLLLVDGGVVRNLPVTDTKEMGADYVIAVDVGAPLYTREELSSIIQVLDQTSSFQIVKSNQEQLDAADFVLKPDISRFSALDFAQVDSLILEGEKTARRLLPALKRSLTSIGYNYLIPDIKRPSIQETINILDIEIAGVDENTKKTLKTLLQMKPPQVLSLEKLYEKIKRVIATGFFQRMDYRLLPADTGFILQIYARKKEAVFFKLGANYNSDLNAALLLNMTLRNPVIRGSRFSLDLRVSDNPAILGEYLVYTKTRPNIGLKLTGLINFYPGSAYEEGQLSDEFNIRRSKLESELFSGFSRNISFSSGLGHDWVSQDQKFFGTKTGDLNLRQSYIFSHLNFDTFDRLHFPTRGTQFSLYGKYAMGGQIKNDIDPDNSVPVSNTGFALMKFTQIFKLSRHSTLHWYNAAGFSRYKAADFINLFYLGRRMPYETRFVPFSGYPFMGRTAGRFAFSGIRFQWEPLDWTFISLNANYGYYRIPYYTLVDEDQIKGFDFEQEPMAGIGLELGGLSRFGPAFLKAEYNLLTERFNFAFQLGFDF